MSFEIAVERVLKAEDATGTGVVTRDPADPGGTTRWGISQRFLTKIGSTLRAEDVTREQAIDLYRTHFWDEYRLELLPNLVGQKVFDFLVNAGPDPAARALQRAVRACGGTLKEDGVLGPATRHAVTLCPEHCLMAALRSEIAGFYRDLDKPRFEAGWVNRAYSS